MSKGFCQSIVLVCMDVFKRLGHIELKRGGGCIEVSWLFFAYSEGGGKISIFI